MSDENKPVIYTTTTLLDVEGTKVITCLEEAFQRKLADAFFEEPITQLFYTQDYSGVAIIKVTPFSHVYLDKFAVKPEFVGTGVGAILFKTIESVFSEFIWRSRKENPYNAIYLQRADGVLHTDFWTLFWKGYEKSEILSSREWLAKRKSSFK